MKLASEFTVFPHTRFRMALHVVTPSGDLLRFTQTLDHWRLVADHVFGQSPTKHLVCCMNKKIRSVTGVGPSKSITSQRFFHLCATFALLPAIFESCVNGEEKLHPFVKGRTFPCTCIFPASLLQDFFEFSFPKKSGRRVSMKITFQQSHKVFNSVPKFRPSAGRQPYPHLWAFFCWQVQESRGVKDSNLGVCVDRSICFSCNSPKSSDRTSQKFVAAICEAAAPFSGEHGLIAFVVLHDVFSPQQSSFVIFTIVFGEIGMLLGGTSPLPLWQDSNDLFRNLWKRQLHNLLVDPLHLFLLDQPHHLEKRRRIHEG